MNRLQELYLEGGQSPWLDNLRRDWLQNGEMQRWVERGVRGVTSNPSIFQKAMNSDDTYHGDLRSLVADGASIEDAYWSLVVDDIENALAVLRPVYDDSSGVDGWVSVEVSPKLAYDAAGTIAAALDLRNKIDEPNLYVKIPGTAEGLEAIEECTAQGVSVNVTLLFSIERYGQVIDAYMAGLERREGNLSDITSVASFFVSRVDTAVDAQLDRINTDEAHALRGQAAVAQARVAYQLFVERFNSPRWENLVARGARIQRPLWASTSTKNPDFPDTLYVDELIGPNTVNTIPDATLAAFEDHGTVARTLDANPRDAQVILDRVAAVGVDLDAVAKQLEREGVDSFANSFDDVLATLDEVAKRLLSR